MSDADLFPDPDATPPARKRTPWWFRFGVVPAVVVACGVSALALLAFLLSFDELKLTEADRTALVTLDDVPGHAGTGWTRERFSKSNGGTNALEYDGEADTPPIRLTSSIKDYSSVERAAGSLREMADYESAEWSRGDELFAWGDESRLYVNDLSEPSRVAFVGRSRERVLRVEWDAGSDLVVDGAGLDGYLSEAIERMARHDLNCADGPLDGLLVSSTSEESECGDER